MPNQQQIEAANRQELDRLKGLIEDLNDQIKHLQVAADKHREKLDHALDRMKAAREILDAPKDSGFAETMFWLGQSATEEKTMAGDDGGFSFDEHGYNISIVIPPGDVHIEPVDESIIIAPPGED